MAVTLSAGALSHLISQTPIDPPILQVLGIRKLTHPSTTDRYRIMLSDGLNSINFAVLATQLNPKIEKREISCNCVIRLNRHITSVFNDDGVKRHVLLLLDLDVLVPGDKMSKIGNPIMYKDNPTAPPPSTGHAASVAPTPTDCNTQPSKTNQFTPIAQLATASLEEMVPIVALEQAKVNDFEGAKSISTDILSTILTMDPTIPEAHKLQGGYNNGADEPMVNIKSKQGGGCPEQGGEEVVEEVVAATNNLAVATNLAIAVESPSTKMARPSVAISPRANNSPARSPSPFIDATQKTPNGHKKVFTRVGRESKKTVRYIELIDESKK